MQKVSTKPPDCGRFFCFGDLMLISIGRVSVTPSKQVNDKPAIRAALYARISTLNHGQNPEVQLRELRDYCQRRGFTITGEYVDKGISGSREKRPALDKLLADCRKRLVDAVVVYRYDRFAEACGNWSTASKSSAHSTSSSFQFMRALMPAPQTVASSSAFSQALRSSSEN